MKTRLTLALVPFLAIIMAAGGLILADPASPVTVSVADSPDPVASGAELLYTITVVNTAGSKLTNMLLSDQVNGVAGIGVPPQLQLSSSRGSCNQSGNLVTCNAGTIEGGGTWVVTIRGVVTAASGTVINDTATVSGTRSAQNFTTTSTTTTLVSGGTSALADLTIGKAGPTSVVAGSPMTYTLTINNTGSANATGVKVVDTLPAGITGITASGTSLFVCGVAGQTVTCDGGAVNQGANATITINATAPAVTGTITNTAVVDPDNTIPESNELNNTSALVNTQVTAAQTAPLLTIDKTDGNPAVDGNPAWALGAGPDPVNPGQTLTYKIHVVNTASTRADDVRVVDGTQGLVAATVTASQVIVNGSVGTFGGCTVAAPQVTCSIKSLNAGGTMDVTIAGQVITSAGSTIFNTATVTGNISNKGVTATDSEITTVKPAIDLTITKADAPDPVCAASWPGPGGVCQGGLTYTFVVGNSGTQQATGVVVRDPLPAGMIYVPSKTTAPGFSGGCSVDAGNVVTCTGGTVNPQSTTPITINVVVPPAMGTITNTVTVDPNNAIFEADETNNTFTQVTTVGTGIDLTVAKHSNHEADFVATRGTLTYTITVSNLGTQDSTSIRVRDTLPADTLFRDAVSDAAHGFTCSQAAGVVECVGGHLQGTESMNYPNLAGTNVDVATITIRIFATAYEQPAMHNEVRVDPLNEIPEANELNNVATQDTRVQRGGATSDAFNQLTISKAQTSPDPTNTARNAVVTYEIKVGNDGTDPVTGVKVRDTLPAGARYIQATGTNSFLCTQAVAGVVDCVGGQIPDHTPTASGATITLTAFAPDTPGTYTNQVEVDPDHTIAEGNEFDNNASAQTVVKNGGAGAFYELSLTKTQAPANPVARNSVVTYTIIVKNTGTDTVNGVAVKDALPAGSRFIAATAPAATQFTCSPSGTDVNCVNGQIAGGGGTATITVTMFAPDTPGTYTNQATVDPANTIPEGDELNNSFTLPTIVQDCTTTDGCTPFNDLQIKKTATDTTTPGGEIDYTIKVWNVGTDPAQNVTVRDVLPAGVTFVSALDAGGPGSAFTCNAVGNVVNCIGATIAGGTLEASARSITIVVTAPQQVTDIVNTAVVDPDNTIPEGDESNNTFTAPATHVVSQIDLTVVKSGPTVANQSSTADYEIKVKNNKKNGSGQNAFGVVMHDPLPVGLIPLAIDAGTGNNWACQIQGSPINVADCLGDLTPDQEVTIKITVFMSAESGRSLDNTACVDPGNQIVETNEFNNCSEFSSSFGDAPKLSPDILVSKNVDKATANPGDTLEYSISVSNVGTAGAKSPLVIEDELKPQLTFGDALATNGWTCAQAAGTVTCQDGGSGLGVGESTVITIHATINGDAAVPIVNTAKVTTSPVAFDPASAQCTSDPSLCVNETGDHKTNNSSTVTTSVGGSGLDFVIAAITDSPDPVNKSDLVTYTIVALNAGSDGTPVGDPVHIRLDIPPTTAATFVGADGTNGFTCGAPASNAIDCSGDMPAGGTTVITLKMAVVAAPPPTLTLVATIDPANHFVELNETNNQQTEVTTVSNDVCSPSCVDIVASQLLPSVDPVQKGHDVTFNYTIVNVGDTAADFGTPDTPADPKVNPLLWFDVTSDGTFTVISRTSSNPAVACVDDVPAGAGSLFSDCAIDHNGATAGGTKLNPGEGVTISIKVHVIDGTVITANGKADPLNIVVGEFLETNNNLVRTITIVP